MFFQQIKIGPMDNFCYLIGDEKTKECAAVDPAWDVDGLIAIAKKNKLNINHILITHTHPDHINGVEEMQKKTKAIIYVHENGIHVFKGLEVKKSEGSPRPKGLGFASSDFRLQKAFVPTLKREAFGLFGVKAIKDNETIKIGNVKIKVLHTPGHIPDAVCYLAGNKLITGDTLFVEAVGRTDLPGGDINILKRSLERIKSLGDDIEVYPGHDYGSVPYSTIGREKRNNVYLQ